MFAPPAAPRTEESKRPLPLRMWRFVRERFPLEVHGVSILVFFVTNAAIGEASVRAGAIAFGPRSLVAALALGLMFLRLRLFDEVKDYEHDLVANPRRPLPRGLLTPREVNRWAAATAGVEGALAAALGTAALGAFLVVLAFTLLMRVEFFVRPLIRPRLLTYAILHTPSGGLIGLFVFSAVTARPFWDAPRAMWLYVAAGWALLMVFELARKTYDPATEPSGDTYSTVFGGGGAALLNGGFVLASTVLILLAVVDALGVAPQPFVLALWGLTAIDLSIVTAYGLAPSRGSAAKVRLAAQIYLVGASLLAAGEVLLARGIAFRADS